MHRICLPISFILTFFFSFTNQVIDVSDFDRKKKIIKLMNSLKATIESEAAIAVDGYHLIDLRDVFVDSDDVEFVDIELKNAHDDSPISISDDVKKSLLNYLKLPIPEGPLNCISFVEKILGVEGDLVRGLKEKGWAWSENPKDQQIALGEVVLLYTDSDLAHPRHTAIKFSNDLYLSKGGPNAPFLLLAELGAMMDLWQAEKILVLKRPLAEQEVNSV